MFVASGPGVVVAVVETASVEPEVVVVVVVGTEVVVVAEFAAVVGITVEPPGSLVGQRLVVLKTQPDCS